MPAFAALTPAESSDLIRYLRTIKPRAGFTPTRTTLKVDGGPTIEGLVFNQSLSDLQLLGNDGKLRLFRNGPSGHRQVTSQTDWASYNGGMNGSRYSPARADQPQQRQQAGSQMDLQPEHRATPGDARRRRRRDVRHERQRVLRASTPAAAARSGTISVREPRG